MPLYEYQCQQCGYRFEALQRFSDAPLTTCEKCGGQLKKLISAPAVQFKGSGWYVTDYAGKGGDSKKDAGDKSSGGETKSESSATSSDGSGSSGSSDSGSSSSGGKESKPAKASSSSSAKSSD